MTFEPVVPWPAVAIAVAALTVGLALGAWRDRRLLPGRALVTGAIALVLVNPVLRTERRAEQPDIAIAVVDRSASMAIGERRRQADAALAELRRATPGVAWRRVDVGQAPGEPTRLGRAIDDALADADAERLAGVVVISDGISADRPDARPLPAGKPLHLLLAGDPATRDRRLIVERAPAYSVAGGDAAVRVRVDDGDAATGPTTTLTQETAGAAPVTRTVPIGEPVTLRVPVTRRGAIDLALTVEPLPGEATLVNNRALVRLNGVTDRLRVLLVSGVPYAGGRAWRDILKSDANVDLVHFTILRLPTSFDTTPPEQMSLIPFPVDELFERHLEDFDLIIFDRFGLSDLLSPLYFDALAGRVRDGGGLLVVAGDEFAAPGGLAATGLAALLPARPAGDPVTTPFQPELTDIGRRHPVTAALGGNWGRWGSQSSFAVERGQVLMTGAGGRPLLVLDRVGRGRVGLIASTSAWWWSRGVDGSGPRDELLRRTAHWLMREPDLDENRLDVAARGRSITIAAHGVEPPPTATLTGPDGRARSIPLGTDADGSRRGSARAATDGLHRVRAAGRTRFVLAGDSAEFAEMRPRAMPIAAAAAATGGGVYWLQRGMPAVRRVDRGMPTSGPSWLGLVANRSGAIVAVDTRPLLAPPLALALLAGALVFAWWRERR
jgi:hypothetical protein